MFHRMTPRILAVVALSGCLTVFALAADKHQGKVVEASKSKLTMTDMDGSNQHSHTVATNAKITRDGKTAKLDDLKKGDVIDVTLGEQSGKEVATEIAARSSKDKQGAVESGKSDKHQGKVVEANKSKLTMTDMDGSNQHSHAVATNAKITRDGKTAKLDDLKKGDTVDVTLGEQSGKEVATEIAARVSKSNTTIEIIKTAVETRNEKVGVSSRREKNKDQAETRSGMEATRASKVIGATVKNQSDEKLGQIEDIVLDPHDGTVNYAVLSFGGFLGLGDKWFAIPWESLSIKYDNDAKDKFHFQLSVDKERLKYAPGFDKYHFPNLGDPAWAVDVDGYYKEKNK